MFTDEELVSAIPHVKKYLKRKFKQDVDDIIQDTLEKVLIKRSLHKSSMPLTAYLKKVSYRTAIDRIRAERTYNNSINHYSKVCKRYQKPNQEETIQLQEVPSVMFDYGLGYTFDELADNLNICKTSVFKQVKAFSKAA